MNNFNIPKILIFLIFILSMGLIIYDLITIITNFNSTWTPFGIITFCASALVVELSYEYLNKNKRK